MRNIVCVWHYQVCDALSANDVAGARAICDAAIAKGEEFSPYHPVDRALRLLVASQTGERAHLDDIEASLAQQADVQIPAAMGEDGRVAAYLLAGLMRRNDEPARAAAHFEAALRISPDFLPARVELECIRRGADREALFGALGEDVPRGEWRYLLAASELGLESGIDPVETTGAICVRGMCTPHTAAMLRLYRWLNPGVKVILATWQHTPPEVIAPLLNLAQVVVVEDPTDPGSQNKNRQITLARAALMTARDHGASHVLMVRTDLAIFASNIVSSLSALHKAYPVTDARMDGRLVIPDLFTRRYREYHLSDIMCFGTFADVVRYWTAPYEEGGGYLSTETYLGWHLTSRVLNNTEGLNHEQLYRRLLRDCVIVRDLDWFDGFWLRHPHMRNGAGLRFGDTCVSQRDWEQMYFTPENKRDLFVENAVVTRAVLETL